MRQRKNSKSESGMSLIELMIGLTIGLIITGTVFSTMLSNQKTLLSKEVLDRTQEDLRFLTNTITRMVRQSTSFQVPTNEHELIIKFNLSQRDCLGNSNRTTLNILKLEGDNLICVTQNEQGQNQNYTLSKNVKHLVFKYGTFHQNKLVYQNYEALTVPLMQIRSIKTEIGVKHQGAQSESYMEFSATSHVKSILD